jgi:hypothetical protein
MRQKPRGVPWRVLWETLEPIERAFAGAFSQEEGEKKNLGVSPGLVLSAQSVFFEICGRGVSRYTCS